MNSYFVTKYACSIQWLRSSVVVYGALDLRFSGLNLSRTHNIIHHVLSCCPFNNTCWNHNLVGINFHDFDRYEFCELYFLIPLNVYDM